MKSHLHPSPVLSWFPLAMCLLCCIVTAQDDFLPFDVWKRSPHKDCRSFSGCLTMEDREVYLNPNATSIPCGFMWPTDLDLVREHFLRDQKCKIVVFTAMAGAYSYVYNPIAPDRNFLLNDSSICYFLFVDEQTLNNGHGLQNIVPGGKNDRRPAHWSKIKGGESWQVILIRNFAADRKGSFQMLKAIKLSGLMLFPNAEWVIYIDTKYIPRGNPRVLADYVKNETQGNYSIAAYAHFVDSVAQGFKGAVRRIIHQSRMFRNSNVDKEISELWRQYNLYNNEGLFKIYHSNRRHDLIDAAILVIRNDLRAKRYFCAWQNEVLMFSRRDQLAFHMVQHRLQIYTYQIWQQEMRGGHRFVQGLGGIKPVHPPKWNMYNKSNPYPHPLHPSTVISAEKDFLFI